MPVAPSALCIRCDEGGWHAALQEEGRPAVVIRRGMLGECILQANRTGAFLLRQGWQVSGGDDLPLPVDWTPAPVAPCSLAEAVFG